MFSIMSTTAVEPSSETQTGSEDSSSSSVGGIVAGCVVGVVVCVVIVVLLILLLVWYQRRKGKNEGTQGIQLFSKYIPIVVGNSVYLYTCIAYWLLYIICIGYAIVFFNLISRLRIEQRKISCHDIS